jgi:hypothetical protein
MDQLTGDVPFEHAGKTYTLRFSTGAMRRFEGATGRKFLAVAMHIGDDPAIEDLVQLMRWGLSDRHELAAEAVDALFDGIGILAATTLVTQALQGAFQPAKPKDASDRPLVVAA